MTKMNKTSQNFSKLLLGLVWISVKNAKKKRLKLNCCELSTSYAADSLINGQTHFYTLMKWNPCTY